MHNRPDVSFGRLAGACRLIVGVLAFVLCSHFVVEAHILPWSHRHPCDDEDFARAHPVACLTGGASNSESLSFLEAQRPKVTAVTILSRPERDGTYALDEEIRVQVVFDKHVVVFGNPRLRLEIGADTLVTAYGAIACVRWRYAGLTNSKTLPTGELLAHSSLIFSYRVQASDRDDDGIGIPPDALPATGIWSSRWRQEIVLSPSPGGGSLGTGPVAGKLSAVLDNREIRDVVGQRVAANTLFGTRAITNASGHKADGRVMLVPTFGSASVGPLRFASGATVSQSMPAAIGGDGALTYTVEPPLPGGLGIDSATRRISGTTTGSAANRRYTLVATDVDGDRGTLDFYLAIGTELTFGSTPEPTLRFRTGHRVDEELPAAVGGDGTVRYSLGSVPALPAGLTFYTYRSRDRHRGPMRLLYGKPTTAHAMTTYTLTATDRDNDKATLRFSIEVTANRTPAFRAETTHGRRFQIGTESVVHNVLPAANGGDGALTYTVSPALPSGLTLAGAPPAISGMPNAVKAEAIYTLTATDIDGDADTLTFPLAVSDADAPKVAYLDIISRPSRSNDTYAAGDAIVVRDGFDNLIAVGGAPRLALDIGTTTRYATLYSTSPYSLDFRYVVQSGDRDADGIAVKAHALELAGGRIQGTDGALAHLAFGSYALANAANHKVDSGPSVSRVVLTSSPRNGHAYRSGETISVEVVFDAGIRHGTRVLPVKVPTLALAIGDSTRHAIVTTATLDSKTFSYQVRASDLDADGISVGRYALSLNGGTKQSNSGVDAIVDFGTHALDDQASHKVDGRPPGSRPRFAASTWTAQRFTEGIADTVTLPAARDGNGTLRYALSPALPAGLSYTVPADATTGGAISGTPTRVAADAEYALTATDSDGDAATLAFHLSVAGAFAFEQAVEAQSYLTGLRVSLALPQATGGEGQVTYALSPELPAGLTFDAGTRVLSGVPTAAKAATTYTLTATDAEGNAEVLIFAIRVDRDESPAFGETPSPQAFRVTEPASATLPAATGGNGVLEYLLAPALPAGLSYAAPADATTGGIIAGTPTEGLAETTYTLTAVDSDDNETSDDAATIAFTLAVIDSVPSFGAATIAPQHYTQGDSVEITLPAAAGGDERRIRPFVCRQQGDGERIRDPRGEMVIARDDRKFGLCCPAFQRPCGHTQCRTRWWCRAVGGERFSEHEPQQ